MHRGGRKFKRFSVGSGFKGQIFPGDLSRVNSAEALRQRVIGNLKQKRPFSRFLFEIFTLGQLLLLLLLLLNYFTLAIL